MEWLGVLIGIGVAILIAAAACQMARRKGRSEYLWGTLALIFSPSFLVLLLIPNKQAAHKRSARPSVTKCAACDGPLSSQATRCPRCGQPQHQLFTHSWSKIEISGVVAASVVLMLGALSTYYTFATTASGLPRCDGSLAQSDVNNALANAPFGKILGLSIVSFDEIRTDDSTNTVVKCSADVTLNNNTRHQLIYSFTKRDDGNYWIEAKLADWMMSLSGDDDGNPGLHANDQTPCAAWRARCLL